MEELNSHSNDEIVEWVPVRGKDHLLKRRVRKPMKPSDLLIPGVIAVALFLKII
ncbi:hypothetical protein KH400_03150 [Desertibacillus haloalkaliphilus]|nr:hypothetical protein [Desertibacillus haloalkaliphilus]